MLKFIGMGAYGIPLAAKLLRLEASRATVNAPAVRRWTLGYERKGNHYAAVVPIDAGTDGTPTASFHDLIELLHVVAFLDAGRTWPEVHEAITVARRHLRAKKRSDRHPLARHEWFADGGALYMRLAEKNGSKALVEAIGDGQEILDECLRAYLKQIVFDENGLARQWFPIGGLGGPVVCDPGRSLGLPITAAGGVRTDVIAGHTQAGDTIETIARYYRIGEHEVTAAIEFESALYAKAA